MPLNDQQHRAISARGISVALGAGAGCGKTTVLTERFVAALSGDDRVPLGRIVALTFTDKAAAELRGRVRAACRARLIEGDEPDYWRGVLRGLESAPIGTFHAFCGGIVRRLAVRAGVDPGYVTLTGPVAASLREQAADACLRRALIERDPDLTTLAVELGLDRVRDHIVRLLDSRASSDLSRWAEAEPDRLVDAWREAFDAHARPAVVGEFLRQSGPAMALIRERSADFHPKMADALGAILALVPEVGSARDLRAALAEIREQTMLARGKWPDPDFQKVASDALKTWRARIDAQIGRLKHDDASTRLAADLGVRLARLASKARDEFDRVKRDRGGLDFDDLLVKARDLFRHEGADLASGFDLILVDEFQDTDPIQDEIVRRLAGDDLQGGRLFLVGDFKQSIYGFRDAVPALFQAHRDGFPAEGRLSLTANYRSRPEVLAFVNALFADTFDGYEPLTPGLTPAIGPEVPAVVFAWPEAREGSEGEASDDRDAERRRSDEAARLARLIRTWIDEGRPIHDQETRQVRAMKARDVAILLRSNEAFAPFERALAGVGLPYHLTGGPGFFNRQEVVDLINVLAAIDDPRDPLALAGALRGPIFALSDEALFWLNTVRPGDLAAGLARTDEDTLPDLSPVDRDRASRASRLLAAWRAAKDRGPIAGLLSRVLDESGFEAALLGEPLGDRKRANARKLVAMAREYDAKGGFALADFVARLRSDLDDGHREDQATTADEAGDAVRLLTIHKAKGLEYPVVILPDLDRKVMAGTSGVVLDPILGPLVAAKAEGEDDGEEPEGSLGWVVHRLIRRRDEEAEALRLFYVATTRARDLLVLSTSGPPIARPDTPALSLLLNRFDAEAGHCRKTLPDGWPSPSVSVVRGLPSGPTIRGTRALRRPPLRAIARLIESAVVDDRASHPRLETSALPGDLSVDPDDRLDPRAARLDRLVRSIVLDPRASRPGGLIDAAREAGRRANPIAPPRLVDEAVDRLSHWLAGPLGREIASSREVRGDIAWTIAWPDPTPDATVISGRIDLAYRDASDAWRLVQFTDPTTPAPVAALRLCLSGHLAPALGLGPIAQAWHIVLGPGGGLSGEDRFGADDVSARLAEVVADLRSTRKALVPSPLVGEG